MQNPSLIKEWIAAVWETAGYHSLLWLVLFAVIGILAIALVREWSGDPGASSLKGQPPRQPNRNSS